MPSGTSECAFIRNLQRMLYIGFIKITVTLIAEGRLYGIRLTISLIIFVFVCLGAGVDITEYPLTWKRYRKHLGVESHQCDAPGFKARACLQNEGLRILALPRLRR